ncbi:hypothetical protein JM83_3246 [Gillisia sp. Hel_I_86]|uniref:hypothetical protein n=1 Tax=Gillisia sp. Hel_I_86 TaxID=1249981 RepID=UPI00119B2681|nr:hypothetical protein [Gillisia sp. Hel_I_86]TVZ28139.1 hypothetical protein JM83_3246 [Gillisia sp. Hel_I_86]
MNIQAEKIELAKLLLNTDNPQIIKSIKQIFRNETPTDFWDDLSSAQKKEIKEASSQIDQGKTIEYESFMAKHR